jgi:hypothetical protein
MTLPPELYVTATQKRGVPHDTPYRSVAGGAKLAWTLHGVGPIPLAGTTP